MRYTPNVLHISRTMGQGGAEKIVEQLCCDIKNHKFIVASTGGYRINNLKKHHTAHYTIPDIASKNPFTMFKTIIILKSIIKKERIGIIHSHHRMAAFYAQLLKMQHPKLRLIYTAHNVYTDKKKLSHFSFRDTKIIACGKSVEKNLTDFYQLPSNQIALITNSVKKPELHETNLLPPKPKGQVYLASISRITNDKGIDIFIQALSLIKQNNSLNFHAFIIGDGEQRHELENQTKRLGLSNHITFLGFQQDALSIITPIDILISPSRREGLPLTLIELLAIGKPVIVSDIDNHKEIITDKRNGLLFKSEDTESLAAQIIRLATGLKLQSKIRQNAKSTYDHTYNYINFLKKYNSLYGENHA